MLHEEGNQEWRCTNDVKVKAYNENADQEQNNLETEAVAASDRLDNLEVEHDEGKENESTVAEEEFYTATQDTT